jgi:hypothetical protein
MFKKGTVPYGQNHCTPRAACSSVRDFALSGTSRAAVPWLLELENVPVATS